MRYEEFYMINAGLAELFLRNGFKDLTDKYYAKGQWVSKDKRLLRFPRRKASVSIDCRILKSDYLGDFELGIRHSALRCLVCFHMLSGTASHYILGIRDRKSRLGLIAAIADDSNLGLKRRLPQWLVREVNSVFSRIRI